jgi:hypothetical protein
MIGGTNRCFEVKPKLRSFRPQKARPFRMTVPGGSSLEASETTYGLQLTAKPGRNVLHLTKEKAPTKPGLTTLRQRFYMSSNGIVKTKIGL